ATARVKRSCPPNVHSFMLAPSLARALPRDAASSTLGVAGGPLSVKSALAACGNKGIYRAHASSDPRGGGTRRARYHGAARPATTERCAYRSPRCVAREAVRGLTLP